MKKERFEFTLIRIAAEVDVPKLVYVKAHTRIVNGKEVKVRAHFRCV